MPSTSSTLAALSDEALCRSDPRIGEVYLAAAEIAARVAELGAEIARDYAGPRAAARRAAEGERRLPRRPLARAADPARLDFVELAGYGGGSGRRLDQAS